MFYATFTRSSRARFLAVALLAGAALPMLAMDGPKLEGKISVHPSHSGFLEDLTWPELYRAIHEEGETTVLIFNGGTDQRGSQNAIGGHTFIARAPISVGDPVRKPGEPPLPPEKRADTGIVGDARRSSKELGKRFINLKVDYGAQQIFTLLQRPAGAAPATGR